MLHQAKQRVKKKKLEDNKFTYHQEKREQMIDELRLFWHHIKMEYQKITNLLGTMSDDLPRFITKKLIEAHDQSDFSKVYIVVKGTITITGTSNRSRKNRPLAFKNNALLISCIWKINNALIENAVDIDACKACVQFDWIQ